MGFSLCGASLFNPESPALPADRHAEDSVASTSRSMSRFRICQDTCIQLDIPVMAHTSESMGKDEAHDKLGGPEGWKSLLAHYTKCGKSPRVNLGHFGGDTDGSTNDWTQQMAELMAYSPAAKNVFADLGYWSELQCDDVGLERCQKAVDRLRRALDQNLGDGERAADRVMFGSDWLMLSRERYWPDYRVRSA